MMPSIALNSGLLASVRDEAKKKSPEATRSAFWGCRACKAARDEATKEAREARRRIGERRDWDDWTQMTKRQ